MKIIIDNIVRSVFTDPKFSSLQLPFRRLRFASSRSKGEDKLIDCVVGLERLLAPDTPNLEITFRFKLRGAFILPSVFGTPRQKQKFMSDLYRLRSSVIHGSATKLELDEMLPKSAKAFIEIFKWFARALKVEHNIDNIIHKIDDSMVEGVSKWAEGINKQYTFTKTPYNR